MDESWCIFAVAGEGPVTKATVCIIFYMDKYGFCELA